MIKFIDTCNVVFDKLDPFSFQQIKNEILEIRNTLNIPEDTKAADQIFAFQQRAIGSLEYFKLPKTENLIKQKVLDLVAIHENKYNMFERMFNFAAGLTDNPQLDFERIWVNVQRQGEFIPLHQHSGLYSFVLWAEIPFYIQDQQANCPNKNIIKDRTSQFEFVHINSLGRLVNHSLPVDKTWEGVLTVFPAELHHQVYPFYNNDGLRISISGNIRLSASSFKD